MGVKFAISCDHKRVKRFAAGLACEETFVNFKLVLVFTVCITVIAVFTDTITGVSKVRTVNRACTDHKQSLTLLHSL